TDRLMIHRTVKPRVGAPLLALVLGVAAAALSSAPTIDEFPTSPGSGPQEIVAGPDGALWFCERDSNTIGRVTTAGSVPHFSAGLSPNARLGAIAAGPSGTLVFVEEDANQIGRIVAATGEISEFRIPTAAAGPGGITLGPDGKVWFAETDANK